MGDLIQLDARRPGSRVRFHPHEGRPPREPAVSTCYLDLADPLSYLVAERIERALPGVRLRPASLAVIEGREPGSGLHAPGWVRATAERRARELRLPLQWPDAFPLDVEPAMRAAAYATAHGRGAVFLLAAGRLAFCGGYDVADPETLAEAAAAAHLPLDGCLEAAGDERLSESVRQTSLRLRARGVERLPAVRVGGRTVWGEERISAYLRAGPRRFSSAGGS